MKLFTLIALVICVCFQSGHTQADYYNAAVVEYNSLGSTILNANEYINIIEKTVANFSEIIDIIVFPESSLSSRSDATFIPSPTEILCGSANEDYADFLKNLSCATVKYGITMVVNLIEKEICTFETCPDNGLVLYNTDVILTPNGSVTTKYRKWNLFGEYGLSQPTEVESPTFKIRNVTFGVFTCFDILFSEPALTYSREINVKHIAFPTKWFSEMPFLTALQAQQMWAHENDAVLLAAEGNNPKTGSSGSGIYVGTLGALETVVVGVASTKVILRKVPVSGSSNIDIKAVEQKTEDIDAHAKTLDGLYLKVDKSIVEHNSVVLNTSLDQINEEVCHGSSPRICCQFDISLSVNQTSGSHYIYQMVAFNGIRSYDGVADGGTEDCAILACLNESLSTCGYRFEDYSQISWPIIFENISITANFTNDPKKIQFPNSLLSNITPIPAQFTSWEREENEHTVIRKYSIMKPQSRLLTFAVYGRDFSRDIQQ